MTLFDTEPTNKIAESELMAAQTLFDGGYIKMTSLEAIQLKIKCKYGIIPDCKKGIEFGVFWDLYGKKVGDKLAIQKSWDHLALKIQTIIIERLPGWKIQFADKKYQPNPETYLNQKRWNDEIIAPVDCSVNKKSEIGIEAFINKHRDA